MCFAMVGACVCSACGSCCCTALSDCKVKHGPASRIVYIFIMLVFCIFAVIMSLFVDTVLYENDILNLNIVWCDSDKTEACETNGSIYRVSFCLFVFFSIHAIVVKFVPPFHWLFFIIKLMCLIAVLVLTYWLPNKMFDDYAEFARVGSYIFLIVQVIVLISWAYETNDKVIARVNDVVDKVDEDDTKINKCELCCIQFGLIATTIIIYIAIIVWIVLMYTWFEPKDGCQFNSTILGLTIVFILIMTVLPIMVQTPNSSIFVSAVVCFYTCYLAFAGLENFPKERCNTFAQDKSSSTQWIGITITTIAICYVGFSVSSKRGVLSDSNRSDEINMELEMVTAKKSQGDDDGDDAGTKSNYDDDADLGNSNYDDDDDDDDKPKRSRREPDLSGDAYAADNRDNWVFHICMTFASVYMAMLYTNWGTGALFGKDKSEVRSMTAVWINISAQWSCILLYVWTLVAPKLFPGRFGMETEDE